MRKTLTFALALTLLAGTGSAFAQDRNNYDRNQPPVTTQQRPDNRNNYDRNQPPVITQQHPDDRNNAATQQRSDDHDRYNAMAMRGPAHPDWRTGGHIARNDWRRGVHVDYRDHHLRRPPRGYEWRQVDGNFVLAAVTTGLIASIILAGH